MYETLIQSASVKWSVPITWIQAVIDIESSWIATAFRAEPQINDASYGLGQFLYKTAQGLGYTGTPEGLYDPATNINLIGKFLNQLRRSYGDNFSRVISAYNSGSPDLYLTNTQVAAHVTKAITALDKYTSLLFSMATGSPVTSAIVLIFVGLLLQGWLKGKR